MKQLFLAAFMLITIWSSAQKIFYLEMDSSGKAVTEKPKGKLIGYLYLNTSMVPTLGKTYLYDSYYTSRKYKIMARIYMDSVVVPVLPPLKIEAEAYTEMLGIQTETTSDVGGGKNVGWQDDGDWLKYSFTVPTAGVYQIKMRVASMFTGAVAELYSVGTGLPATDITIPNTGSFQKWTTITATVQLKAGLNQLGIATLRANGGWNINWFEISYSTFALPRWRAY